MAGNIAYLDPEGDKEGTAKAERKGASTSSSISQMVRAASLRERISSLKDGGRGFSTDLNLYN